MPPVRGTTSTASAPPAATRRQRMPRKSDRIVSGSVAGNILSTGSRVDREGHRPQQTSRLRRREYWQCGFLGCDYEGAKKKDVVAHATEAHRLPLGVDNTVEQQGEVAVKAEPLADNIQDARESAPFPVQRPQMPTFSVSPQFSTFGRPLRYTAYREMYKERQLERYRCYKDSA